MKIAFASLYTAFCILLSLVWMGLMAYGMGMGGMGGSLKVADFSQFWIYAPIIISLLCGIAVWLPLDDLTKTGFALFLIAAAAFSSLLHFDGSPQDKISTILIGITPLHILIFAWLVSYASNLDKTQKPQ